MKRSITFFVVVAVVALVTLAARASQDPTAATPFDQSQSAAAAITITSVPASMGTLEERIQRGFTIAPVPLNLRGKNVAFVGLGSYIVNAQGGCNDCHTNPPYAPGGNPFMAWKNRAILRADGSCNGFFVPRSSTRSSGEARRPIATAATATRPGNTR